MVLTAEQRAFWSEHGYLVWEEPLLTPDELEMLARRLEDIGTGRLTHVPPEHFRYVPGADPEAAGPNRYDIVQNIAFVHRYDELVRSIVGKPSILDIVEDLLGPNIKLYTEQFFMKPPYHGAAQSWHQDSETWTFFAPHDHVTCWIAIDEATPENGCLHYLAGSHRWGYVDRPHYDRLVAQLQAEGAEVVVPRKPGYGAFHHSLTFHYTGPNRTPYRRRGIAIHYIRAETRYIGNPGDRQPPFLLLRGRETPGRV